MARWRDRSWLPSEEERAAVAGIPMSPEGQTLLRMLDHEMLRSMESVGLSRVDTSEVSLAKLHYEQGFFQALNVVSDWLLNEPDKEPNSE